MGGEYKLKIVEGYPATGNDQTIIMLLEEAAAGLVGREHLIEPDPEIGAEDFGFFVEKAAGMMFFPSCNMPDFKGRHQDPQFDVN